MNYQMSLLATGTAILLAVGVACGPSGEDGTTDDTGSADVGPTADTAQMADAGADASGEPPCELTRAPAGEPFETLSEYCFFRGRPAEQHLKPSEGVVPYAVRSKLYSDESDKFRFIVLPEGETVGYDAEEMWAFPDGTIIVKTFYFPNDARKPAEGRRLLETRLLVKEEGEWEPYIYHFNDEQTEARRDILGADREVTWTNEEGKEVTTNYRIPNQNKCKSCHQLDNDIALLGPRTRQMNREYDYPGHGTANQLDRMDAMGMFDESPGDPSTLDKLADPKDESLELETRARAYMEGNCAHCHRPGGGASNSGMFVGIEQEDPQDYGVCKQTVAAGGGTGGLKFDIKPGYPEESILIFRMRSNDPEIKMPELPLRTVDTFGANLLAEWIKEMRPKGCNNDE